MQEYTQPLAPIHADKPLLSTHWQVREVKGETGTTYVVVGVDGAALASNINSLELARLFALAPQVFENFKSLRLEAERALYNMVDCDVTQCDLVEVAEDCQGEWEEAAPGAPEFASWLIALEELEMMVGPQTYPPKGVAVQLELL